MEGGLAVKFGYEECFRQGAAVLKSHPINVPGQPRIKIADQYSKFDYFDSHLQQKTSLKAVRLLVLNPQGIPRDGLINIMSEQNKRGKPGTSLIAALYASWEQYKIPAIFYHYTLSVLTKREKKEQISLMTREIKQLQTNNHPYHLITNSLEARERSLDIVKRNVNLLMKGENAAALNWAATEPEIQTQGYNVIYESRAAQRRDSRSLIELINHLKLYQKVTYQVIVSVYNWQLELYRDGYEGPIQFLYQHEDYLQKITKDTKEITDQYDNLFENNPFLIFKREHENSEFALIYKNVKFSPQFAAKIEQALEIISNHDTAIERHRILGSFKQFGSRKKITKSESLHKIYCNYNNSKDFMMVKDYNLKSDRLVVDSNNRFKFLNNRNILINPQFHPNSSPQKKHPVYVRDSPVSKQETDKSQPERMTRSTSLHDIKIKQIKHRASIVVSTNLNSYANHGKLLQKKLSLYDQLDKIRKNQSPYVKKETFQQQIDAKQKIHSQMTDIEKNRLKTPSDIIEEEPIEARIAFVYDSNISPYEIIRYLRDTVFAHKQFGLKEIESMAKRILTEKEYITLVRVMNGEFIAAWLTIKFLTKDVTIRRAVDIIFIHKFIKIPNLQQQLIEQFMRKGYGIVRDKGQLVHEIDLNSKISQQLLKIKYKVSLNMQEGELKHSIKKDECLKESRLLKYYYYSKQSKYHKYCDHSDNCCQIGYDFEQVFKICVSGHFYLRARCDKISKVRNCYRIQHHLNQTDLIIGHTLEDILDYSKKDEIQFNSSFQADTEEQYLYLCLPESKIMHKYVNFEDKPSVVEYITVSGDIPEVLSINGEKKSLKNYLIIEKPFCAAIVCKTKEDFGKGLAILKFD